MRMPIAPQHFHLLFVKLKLFTDYALYPHQLLNSLIAVTKYVHVEP